MTFSHPYQRNDWIALQTARLVARRLRENPDLVERGREQIRRARDRGYDFSAYREWEVILTSRTVEEIATLLEAESEEGQRLRSSRPFVGSPFVTDLERKEILERAFTE
jgi:hypothetical protein